MNAAAMTWKLLRVARWALWIAFFGYGFYVHAYHEALVNQFGHLSLGIETTIFGLANAAVFAGLLEMMMRERAGIARPSYRSSSRQGSQPREG
jgi:hypothetical protein